MPVISSATLRTTAYQLPNGCQRKLVLVSSELLQDRRWFSDPPQINRRPPVNKQKVILFKNYNVLAFIQQNR